MNSFLAVTESNHGLQGVLYHDLPPALVSTDTFAVVPVPYRVLSTVNYVVNARMRPCSVSKRVGNLDSCGDLAINCIFKVCSLVSVSEPSFQCENRVANNMANRTVVVADINGSDRRLRFERTLVDAIVRKLVRANLAHVNSAHNLDRKGAVVLVAACSASVCVRTISGSFDGDDITVLDMNDRSRNWGLGGRRGRA